MIKLETFCGNFNKNSDKIKYVECVKTNIDDSSGFHTELSFKILEHKFNIEDHMYNEHELYNMILEKCSASFEAYKFNAKNRELIFNKAKNDIARKSRRGTNVVEIFNMIYVYVGAYEEDLAIYISKDKNNGKYAVFFHPNFGNYGFKLEEEK